MKISWTKGLDEQGVADVQSSFKAGTRLRSRLIELCEGKAGSSLSTNKDQYESPNWCYQQADNVGYRRALTEIISLLEK
jgi:hypothetical protein